VADDEPQLLRVLVRVLEKSGYPVMTATDAPKAISAFRAAPDKINVVVLDGAIDPHGAGEVLEAVVKERPQVGVVITSGDRISDSLRSLMLSNDGIFLRKPFPPSALLRAVEDSLIKEDE
jgi:DNA-binding NtrC family response regulator